MNNSLKDFATTRMKELIAKCTDPQQRNFKLMYGMDNGKRSVEDAEALPIDEVVEMVPENRFSLALDQIERTIENNKKRLPE